MTSYRFCRSDDVPLLVEAHNRCYRPLIGDREELTVEGFKGLIRELNLWTSSCMVASAGDEPIAVVLAGKREMENWVFRVAVHPDFRRQGHGSHLLDSLSQKMAILGPPRLLAEVPEADESSRLFFESCGYGSECTLTDFVAEPLPEAPPPPIVASVAFEDVAMLLEDDPGKSWLRRNESLHNQRDQLRGFAVVSDTKIEAFTLYRDHPGGPRVVLALGFAGSSGARTRRGGESNRGQEMQEALCKMLLIQLRRSAKKRVLVPRLAPEEVGLDALRETGFEAVGSYLRHAAEATSG